ncbi:MAG: hypothetical protein ACJ77A_09390 [Actinomycetota bacterium]
MAFRKEKIKAQYEAVVQPALEPGEQVLAGTYCQTGPSPWLQGGVGLLIMLLMGAKWYYLVVTDRRLLWFRASMWSARPKGGVEADPRSGIQIHDVDVDNVIWSKFRVQRPTGKDVRVNVHRIWRDEVQHLIAALTGQGTPQPVQPPAPAVQPPAQGGQFSG